MNTLSDGDGGDGGGHVLERADMSAYYNEHEPYAAQWLRNLILAGHIAPGDVDERDIQDVQPDDLRGYTQCHFFAGIGGWSYALRLAGWADDRLVWSGSCPCQPFSSAGKGRGKDDARHLWPQFRRLIRQCRPPVVFGEQVTSQAGRTWLSAVCADLEALGYRAAGADLCGPSVGAFDIRQRLWFVADTAGELDDAHARRRRSYWQHRISAAASGGRPLDDDDRAKAEDAGVFGGMGHANRQGWQARGSIRARTNRRQPGRVAEPAGQDAGPWSEVDWIPCTDGKARPVEPGTFPLAHGVPNRVGRLRAYGNAIKPHVAAEFIGAYLDAGAM